MCTSYVITGALADERIADLRAQADRWRLAHGDGDVRGTGTVVRARRPRLLALSWLRRWAGQRRGTDRTLAVGR